MSGGNTTLRGLILNRVSNIGLLLMTSGGNTVAGNYIGLNSAGSAVSGSMASSAVYINGVANNTVGGTAAADSNWMGAMSGTPCASPAQGPPTMSSEAIRWV